MAKSNIFTNIICGFIPTRRLRSRVRVRLNNPCIGRYLRWVRTWGNENCGGATKIKTNFGVGCQNVIITLNDTHVFKFPLHTRRGLAERELRICDCFRDISPIMIPNMELFKWRGIIIRRYDFVRGKLLCDFSPSYVMSHREHLARQLANFMYTLGCADPKSLRDLKPTPNAKPGYLYGWFHNDIGQNFLMDDDMNIIGFIDWEGCEFCDWRGSLRMAERFWNKNGYKGLMTDVLYEYSKLYTDKIAVKK